MYTLTKERERGKERYTVTFETKLNKVITSRVSVMGKIYYT